jgi:AcrR family transcriptional regulator
MLKNIFSARTMLGETGVWTELSVDAAGRAQSLDHGVTAMPYTKEHKEKTRARIVDSARRLFNRHGFTGVSIGHIMVEAGLTRGGFYNHFGTKEKLYAAVVVQVLDGTPASCWSYVRQSI